jgi:hypothetical protein
MDDTRRVYNHLEDMFLKALQPGGAVYQEAEEKALQIFKEDCAGACYDALNVRYVENPVTFDKSHIFFVLEISKGEEKTARLFAEYQKKTEPDFDFSLFTVFEPTAHYLERKNSETYSLLYTKGELPELMVSHNVNELVEKIQEAL